MQKIFIIGAGLSGLAIAYKLIKNEAKDDIFILESGYDNFSFKKQRLNKQSVFTDKKNKRQLQDEFIINQCEGDRHYLDRLRFRRVGGTANYWGSECLLAQKRDLLRNSIYGNWPISYEELYKYYEEVANTFGFKIDLFNESVILPGLKLSFWQFSEHIQYIRDKFLNEINLNQNVVLLKDKTLIDFVGENNTINKIVVSSASNDIQEYQIDTLVLAAGAVENASLLLNSKFIKSNVDYGTFDNIGRFFSEIPHGYIATIKSGNYEKLDKLLYNPSNDQFTQGCIRIDESNPNYKETIPASLAVKKMPSPEYDYILSARNIFRKIALKDVNASILKDAFNLFRSIINNLLFAKTYVYKVWILCAPSIDYNNRVMLENDTNATGHQRVRVHWASIDNIQHTILKNLDALKNASGVLSIDELEPIKEIYNNQSLSNLNGGAHHLCTTRMSTDEKFSVVDKNCKLNNINNLYIAGCSVFSNTFPANSTITSIALSFRLADFLKKSS